MLLCRDTGIPKSLHRLRLGPRLQDSRLLTCHAVLLTKTLVHFACGVLGGLPVALLQTPSPLIPFTCHAIEAIIGEMSPPLLDLSALVFPLAF